MCLYKNMHFFGFKFKVGCYLITYKLPTCLSNNKIKCMKDHHLGTARSNSLFFLNVRIMFVWKKIFGEFVNCTLAKPERVASLK